jgi:hypothetical protein
MNAIVFAATHELRITPVGSRVTCVPAPVGTDQDYLMRVSVGRSKAVADALARDAWEFGGSLHPTNNLSGWASFRKGEENIILTWDEDFHAAFLIGTEAAKALNLLNKEDRILLFQAIFRNWPTQIWGYDARA